VVAIVLVGAAVLSGGVGPRPASAVTGVLQNPANGHWYKWYPGPVTWQTAKGNAAALKGYLATVTSAAEHSWIIAHFTVGGTWLGATDEVTEGTWKWITGEAWSYTNWQSGEPNNSGGTENYLEYQSGSTQWNDAPSTDPDGYLVEWDSDPNGGPPTNPPAAPSDLVGTVYVGYPILLSWTDNSSDEDGFEVERRTVDTSFARVATTGPGIAAYQDAATDPEVAYTYRVRAENSAGTSAYTNEATVTSSPALPPEQPPRAPSGLVVVSATRDSVGLSWSDNSIDEIGFEVDRRSGNGAFQFVALTEANASSFLDTGLPASADFVYGVRAVSATGASVRSEADATTLPTLGVTALRGDLKDSPKFGKDSLKFTASYEFLAGESDGAADPVAEGIALRAGTDAAPVVMNLPPDLAGWKVRGTKAAWKSPKGSSPKYSVQVDLQSRLVKVSITGLELATLPANPMRVSIAIGNDAGAARDDWEMPKPGIFRLR
jgi:hypothetical protein